MATLTQTDVPYVGTFPSNIFTAGVENIKTFECCFLNWCYERSEFHGFCCTEQQLNQNPLDCLATFPFKRNMLILSTKGQKRELVTMVVANA